MRHYNFMHNTPEWFAARAGLATSSEFSQLLTPTGKPSSSAEGYANAIVAELLLGEPIAQEWKTYATERGHELEGDAWHLYQFKYNVDLELGGLFVNDDNTRACSPDGIAGEDGLVEIKCPKPETHIEYLLMQEINPKYKPQVQGQLLISGRDWVDWFSYHPELPCAHIRTYRDEDYIGLLERELDKLDLMVKEKMHQLLNMGHIEEIPKKVIVEPKKKIILPPHTEQQY